MFQRKHTDIYHQFNAQYSAISSREFNIHSETRLGYNYFKNVHQNTENRSILPLQQSQWARPCAAYDPKKVYKATEGIFLIGLTKTKLFHLQRVLSCVQNVLSDSIIRRNPFGLAAIALRRR